MADLLNFTLTPQLKAVYMQTGDAIHIPEIDYRSVDIQISSIEQVIKEENDADGINVILSSGTKHTINPLFVTSVGNEQGTVPVNYGLPGDPYLVFPDTATLRNAIINLIGW